MLQKGFGSVADPAHIRKFRAEFDSLYKSAATAQFMEQNCATFDEATSALGFAHGVDFLFFCEPGEAGNGD